MAKIPVKYDPVTWAARLLDVELFGWQQEFLRAQAAALLDPATAHTGSGIVACCGRQSGKTTANAVSLLWYAVAFPGTRQFVVAPIAPQSKLIWHECGELLSDSVLEQTYAIDVRQADYPSITVTVEGEVSRVDFRSVGLDPGRLRGPHANRIFGDEAARIAGGVFQSDLLPMMSAQQHRQLVMTSTPLFMGDYFHASWLRGQDPAEPHMKSFQYPSIANPRITWELLESYRKGMTDEAFQVEFQAAWVNGVGCYFPWPLIQSAIDHTILSGPQSGRTYVLGYDQAQKRDRSGVAVLECTSSDPCVVPWQVVQVLDVAPDGEAWEVQARDVARLARAYGDAPVMLDMTHNPAMATLLRREGVAVEDYRFTASPTQKSGLYDRLKAALEQGSLKLAAHEDLERELRFIRREVSERGRVSLGAPARTGHYDDLTTAVALALELAQPAEEALALPPYFYLQADPVIRAKLGKPPMTPEELEAHQRRIRMAQAASGVRAPSRSVAPAEEGTEQGAAPTPVSETDLERRQRRLLERAIWDEDRWRPHRWD